MDYEAALISKVVVEKKMSEVLELSFRPELITTYSGVWSYLTTSYADYGDTPPAEEVEKKFPDFEIQIFEAAIPFLVDELRKRKTHSLIQESLKKQVTLLKDKDPYAALEEMRDLVIRADVDTRVSRDVNIADDPEARLAKYEEVATAGGVTGLPSPWKCLDELTQGFHPEDLIMLAGRGGIGKCVDSQSRIVDPLTGVERIIEEVIHGSQATVWSWDESFGIVGSPIQAKVDTGTKDCFEIEVESGRKIVVTPEHPFLTPEGWLRADKLSVGDYVGLPKEIPEPLRTRPMAIKDIRFLALLLSEGSYSGNHVGFSTEDLRMIAIAEEFVEGSQATVKYRSGYDYDITVGNVGGHTPNPARELLRSLNIDGKKATNKVIPDEVYRLPNAQLAEFLSVFWMAYGYVDCGSPGVTLASERMVEQLQHLLLRFGVQSSVHPKPVKGGYFSWRLRVYSQEVERFHQSIPLWGDKEKRVLVQIAKSGGNPNIGGPRWRTKRDWDKKGIHWDRVAFITHVGERKIYDLTVSKTHNFLANDIVVHNTWCEVVLAWFHWTSGYVPLLFSKEMAVWQIIRRLDAVNAQIPYKRFRAGQLTSKEFERWKQALRDMKGGKPFWVTGDDEGTSGVSGIQAKIKRYRPNVVYIDGGYLIEDERKGKANWERFSNVCWDLKKLARKEGIPIILTHQFNLEGKGDKGSADTLAYGDVQKWFDVVLGQYQTEDLRLAKEMLFRILKLREGDRLEWVTEWDLDNMNFAVKDGGKDDVGASVPTDELKDEIVDY